MYKIKLNFSSLVSYALRLWPPSSRLYSTMIRQSLSSTIRRSFFRRVASQKHLTPLCVNNSTTLLVPTSTFSSSSHDHSLQVLPLRPTIVSLLIWIIMKSWQRIFTPFARAVVLFFSMKMRMLEVTSKRSHQRFLATTVSKQNPLRNITN